MAKYVYPAVFTAENDGGYSIEFPDLDGCFTQGNDTADALDAANDALCLMLYHMEKDKKDIPAPSDIRNISAKEGSFVSLVSCDTIEYKKFYDNKAIKRRCQFLPGLTKWQKLNISIFLRFFKRC